MSRPFVHLMWPWLGIALDPLRPMLCERIGVGQENAEETLGFRAEGFGSGRGDRTWIMGMQCIRYLRC